MLFIKEVSVNDETIKDQEENLCQYLRDTDERKTVLNIYAFPSKDLIIVH